MATNHLLNSLNSCFWCGFASFPSSFNACLWQNSLETTSERPVISVNTTFTFTWKAKLSLLSLFHLFIYFTKVLPSFSAWALSSPYVSCDTSSAARLFWSILRLTHRKPNWLIEFWLDFCMHAGTWILLTGTFTAVRRDHEVTKRMLLTCLE